MKNQEIEQRLTALESHKTRLYDHIGMLYMIGFLALCYVAFFQYRTEKKIEKLRIEWIASEAELRHAIKQ